MNAKDFLMYCKETYGTEPDYPFEGDFETAVLRHRESNKWYALVMRVSRRKFGSESDEVVEVVNLKLPIEMFGSFGADEGVYPAYHMNKRHWISLILHDASAELTELLTSASFLATESKRKNKRNKEITCE